MNAVIFTSRLCKVEEAGSVDDDHPTINRRSPDDRHRHSRSAPQRGHVSSRVSLFRPGPRAGVQ
jgi:hypothetical protein